MKIVTKFIIIVSLCLNCFSCKIENQLNDIYQVETIKEMVCKNVPSSIHQIQSSPISRLQTDHIMYINPKSFSLEVYSMKNGNITQIPTPGSLFNHDRNSFANFYYRSQDSIYFYNKEHGYFMLFDSSGKVLNKHPIEDVKRPSPAIKNFYTITSDLIYSWFPENAELQTTNKRKLIFDTIKPICALGHNTLIDSMHKAEIFGEFPESYKTGKNYYSFGPSLYCGLRNELIVSYEADHTLFIYDKMELSKTIQCQSNFINKFNDIPDDMFKNLRYCKVFQGQEPRYTDLIIDPFSNNYYRVVKPRIDLKKSNINEISWSIIVMNKEFDVLYEVQLPFSEYLPEVVLPTKEGLFVKKSPKSKTDFYGDLILSLIKFNS